VTDPEHSDGPDPRYPGGPGEPYHAGPDPAAPPPGGAPTVPAAPARRSYRAESVRGVIFSRGAGWAVSAVLAGAVVALSILLAEGSNGPSAVRVFNAPVPRQFIGPQAVPAGPNARIHAPVVAPPGGLPPGAVLPRLCAQAIAGAGGASAPPSGSATPAPVPSASPGQGQIKISLPGGRTCTIQVKPG
jgi:hypothetical protein